MIWSNVALEATERKFPWGEMHCFTLGRQGWGQRELVLPCEPGTKIMKGGNSLSVELTERGIPRVVPEKGDTWVLIDTIGGNPVNGHGWLYIPESQTTVQVVAVGKSKEGLDERYSTGGWCSYLIRPVNNQPFQVVAWEAGWCPDPLHRGFIIQFDPDFRGAKVRMMSIADAILNPDRFCGEIEHLIVTEHQKSQRDLSAD